jgi:hypothetical protein
VSEPPLRHAQRDRNERRLQRRERRRSHVHAEPTERWANRRQSSAQTHSTRLTLSPTLLRCAAELQPHNCTASHLWSSEATAGIGRYSSEDCKCNTGKHARAALFQSNETSLPADTPSDVSADAADCPQCSRSLASGATWCRHGARQHRIPPGLLHSGANRL